ncbi:MAG: hypothetical protein KDA61_10130 [Planctomycetales bacterium]|nr:hypothetical protein [Planctomycetales bacterium]
MFRSAAKNFLAILCFGVCVLAAARLPAQISLVGGPTRMSFQGTDGDITTDSSNPAGIYSPSTGEHLVFWSGGLASGELEIFGQRVGSGGSLTGANFKISSQGPANNASFNARDPAVSYNSLADEFLVVWEGDRTVGENEIFGQRIALDGSLLGNNFAISSQGSPGDALFDAFDAAVAYNSVANEYLIVWEGDKTNNEFEIFGQRLSGAGALLGDNFLVSHQGLDGDASFDAVNPAVSYSPSDNQYLVAWQGDRVAGEVEIYAQTVGSNGVLSGSAFQVSAQGPDGDLLYDAENAAISYNPIANEFMLTWQGDRTPSEKEIFAQRASASGALLGPNVRVSFQGVDGDINIDALDPAVLFNENRGEFLVTWSGDVGGGEFEIHGQRVSTSGALLDANEKISNQGPVGDTLYRAQDPTISVNSATAEYVVLWKGDLQSSAGIAGELEVFGQRVNVPAALAAADFNHDGVVDGDDFSAWSAHFGIAQGATQVQGDADGDGIVGGRDLLLWQRQYAGAPNSAATAAVPEPQAFALGVLLASTLALRRRALGMHFHKNESPGS